MFLNRYLDIYEAIEEKDISILEDNEEFRKTDFPDIKKIKLNEKNMINENEKNQIRDWLLKVTVNKNSEFKL